MNDKQTKDYQTLIRAKPLFWELYEDIKHGDDEHQKWLKDKIGEFIKNKMGSFVKVKI